MYTEIYGDITEVDNSSVILQVCNVAGGYGLGLADSIAKKWPLVKTLYRLNFEQKKLTLGTILPINVDVKKNIWVVNMMAMPTYRKDYKDPTTYLDYMALEACLLASQSLVEGSYRNYDYITTPRISEAIDNYIYVPRYLGCGNAGGDWETVRKLLDKCLLDYTLVELKK